MSVRGNSNPAQSSPGEKYLYKLWILFLRCIRHESAPHWSIAALTLILAIFAYRAWDESTRATAALQGQLAAMRVDQRPYIYLVNPGIGPEFRFSSTGESRIVWNIALSNYGKGIAYNINSTDYLLIGEDVYRISDPEPKQSALVDNIGISLPPTGSYFQTIMSRPGIDEAYFKGLLQKDFGIGFLIELSYTDASGKEFYTDRMCFQRWASGALAMIDASTCKKG